MRNIISIFTPVIVVLLLTIISRAETNSLYCDQVLSTESFINYYGSKNWSLIKGFIQKEFTASDLSDFFDDDLFLEYKDQHPDKALELLFIQEFHELMGGSLYSEALQASEQIKESKDHSLTGNDIRNSSLRMDDIEIFALLKNTFSNLQSSKSKKELLKKAQIFEKYLLALNPTPKPKVLLIFFSYFFLDIYLNSNNHTSPQEVFELSTQLVIDYINKNKLFAKLVKAARLEKVFTDELVNLELYTADYINTINKDSNLQDDKNEVVKAIVMVLSQRFLLFISDKAKKVENFNKDSVMIDLFVSNVLTKNKFLWRSLLHNFFRNYTVSLGQKDNFTEVFNNLTIAFSDFSKAHKSKTRAQNKALVAEEKANRFTVVSGFSYKIENKQDNNQPKINPNKRKNQEAHFLI